MVWHNVSKKKFISSSCVFSLLLSVEVDGIFQISSNVLLFSLGQLTFLFCFLMQYRNRIHTYVSTARETILRIGISNAVKKVKTSCAHLLLFNLHLVQVNLTMEKNQCFIQIFFLSVRSFGGSSFECADHTVCELLFFCVFCFVFNQIYANTEKITSFTFICGSQTDETLF